MKQLTDEQVIKEAIASTLTAEEKALGAFLGAMHDCKLDGAKMREAMLGVLGLTGEAQPSDGRCEHHACIYPACDCDAPEGEYITGIDGPPLQPATDGKEINFSPPEIPDNSFDAKASRDWSLLKATQESLREHMALVKELREKQDDDKAGGEVWRYAALDQFGNAAFCQPEIYGAFPVYTHPQPQAIPAGYALVPKRLPSDTEMRPVIARMCRAAEQGRCVLYDDFWDELIAAAPKVK